MKKADEKLEIKGVGLVQALFKKAEQESLDKYDLCSHIGITYPYLNALSNGHRPISGIGLDKLRKIGEFLGLTFVQVQMLAEIISPSDFVKDKDELLEHQLNNAIEDMRANAEWGSASPSLKEWNGLSLNTKIGIALLWQNFTNKKFVETAKMILLNKEQERTENKSARKVA
jgi:hypothetical protein